MILRAHSQYIFKHFVYWKPCADPPHFLPILMHIHKGWLGQKMHTLSWLVYSKDTLRPSSLMPPRLGLMPLVP
jgi:hypothetical protein